MIIFIASFTKSTLLMENALGEMELNLLDVFGIIGGNPEARYIRRSIKEFRALARNQARSIRRNALKRISVDSNEELIEEVETIIFQSENKFGKWYWFD